MSSDVTWLAALAQGAFPSSYLGSSPFLYLEKMHLNLPRTIQVVFDLRMCAAGLRDATVDLCFGSQAGTDMEVSEIGFQIWSNPFYNNASRSQRNGGTRLQAHSHPLGLMSFDDVLCQIAA